MSVITGVGSFALRLAVATVVLVALFAVALYAGLSTSAIVLGLLFWVLPVFVGYRLTVSKDRASPLVLAVLLSWLGVLFAVALPAAGKRCPRCAETIRRDAAVCRFCGTELGVLER